MKTGQRVRIKTDELSANTLSANNWRRDEHVVGEISAVSGSRIAVVIGGDPYWFDADLLEPDTRQPRLL